MSYDLSLGLDYWGACIRNPYAIAACRQFLTSIIDADQDQNQDQKIDGGILLVEFRK